MSDPEYGGLCADYSALSDDEGLSTTPLLPSRYPHQGFYSNSSKQLSPEAAFVTHKSSILGVCDGAVTFPLRTEVSAIAAGSPTTHVLNVYTSIDLLVMCTWMARRVAIAFLPLR
jgi:hypothetical protein